jgi:hypothetical protein
MENRAQDLIHLLPYSIRDKTRGYLGYVHDRLVDLALEEGVYDRIREITDKTDLIFLLRLLYGYFVLGFRNYEQMLGFFESKDVRGFKIGSTAYTRQSHIFLEWRQVADEIERLINEARITLYVKPTLSVDEVLHRIIDSLPNEAADVEHVE